MMNSNKRNIAYALIAYLVLTFILFGRLWLFKPANYFLGAGADPYIFVFMFKWWVYTFSHHINPFYLKYIWAPVGSNMMLTTNIPLFGILMMPVTKTLGAVFSFNLLITLAPAFSAFVMYLFLRWLTNKEIPSWVGGYFFGFSTYSITHMYNGHINLVWLICLPLIVWLICLYFRKAIATAWFVVGLIVCLLAQFLISKEIFSILTMGLAFWGFLAFAFYWQQRARLLRIVALVVLAYIVTMLLLSPMLYYAAIFPRAGAYHPPGFFSADLLNFIVPTQTTWLGGNFFSVISDNFSSVLSEQTDYLGLPLIALIIVMFTKRKNSMNTWLTLSFFCFFLLLSLGPFLYVGGTQLIELPWFAISYMPLTMYVLPARYAVLLSVVIAYLITKWIIAGPWTNKWRYALVVLVAIFLLPNPQAKEMHWAGEIKPLPQQLKNYIPNGARVLVLSHTSPLMMRTTLWNLQNHWFFYMTSGNLGPGATSNSNATAVQLFDPKKVGEYYHEFIDYIYKTQSTLILVTQKEYHKEYKKYLAPLTYNKIAVGDVYLLSVKPKVLSSDNK